MPQRKIKQSTASDDQAATKSNASITRFKKKNLLKMGCPEKGKRIPSLLDKAMEVMILINWYITKPIPLPK